MLLVASGDGNSENFARRRQTGMKHGRISMLAALCYAGTKAAANDFGFSVLASGVPAEKTKNLTAELVNESLAIMAIIGMFLQAGLTGSAWGACGLYTASPLRATENDLGGQASFGFCEPGGFTADGNSASFARRHQTELKHGRDCRLAAMGYIAPEITGILRRLLRAFAGPVRWNQGCCKRLRLQRSRLQ